MRLRRFFRSARFLMATILVALLLAPEFSAFASEDNRLRAIVGLREFDYVVWETDALFEKGGTALASGQQYLDEAVRKEIVLDYLAQVRQAQALEAQLNQLYSDPSVFDPASESQAIQDALADTRQALEQKQRLAEAIVQEQVAVVLMEQGFHLLGGAWPPVLMHVSPLPSLLVVSPRDRIEKINQVSLQNGLSTPDKEALESAVFEELDRSALVVPLGGIGTYPAMIRETSDINRLVEVVVHEWAHHWLTLRPLGISYAYNSDSRIINETVASLIDQELGPLVVERFYPEFLPLETPQAAQEPQSTPDADAFDFQTELAQTRIQAEAMLAEGRIEDAERYMEERRLLFLDNGYLIRKINQAYFAFYGAYAAEPGGAQGGNPIGPMLRDIRAHSPTLLAFLEAIAPVTSLDDLVDVYRQLVPAETVD
jgi:hypothetical protein